MNCSCPFLILFALVLLVLLLSNFLFISVFLLRSYSAHDSVSQVQLEALGLKPEVLSVDNFYKGWPDITSEGPHKVDWESLDSLNLTQLNEVYMAP